MLWQLGITTSHFTSHSGINWQCMQAAGPSASSIRPTACVFPFYCNISKTVTFTAIWSKSLIVYATKIHVCKLLWEILRNCWVKRTWSKHDFHRDRLLGESPPGSISCIRIYTILFLATVSYMFQSIKEISNQSIINHEKDISPFFFFFSIVVSNPSNRRWELTLHLIIPKLKMNASSLLKSHSHFAVCFCDARQNWQMHKCDGIQPSSSQPICRKHAFHGQTLESHFRDINVVLCSVTDCQ